MITPFSENQDLTYVVRCHSITCLSQLEDALVSIAGQQYAHIQAFIAVQDLKPEEFSLVLALAAEVKATTGLQTRAENISFDSKGDHRGALLNRAFELIESRYVAVLDYDDVVYPNHASTLVADLQADESGNIVGSFCGCTKAMYDRLDNGSIHITKKIDYYVGGSVGKCLIENCFPIHSYVLDRARIQNMPKFWEERSVFEDYWFLIHLFQNYQVSTRLSGKCLCEYRQCNSGGNTALPTMKHAEAYPEQLAKWGEAGALISDLKKSSAFKVSYEEILRTNYPQSYLSALATPPRIQSLVVYHFYKYIMRKLGNEAAKEFVTSPAPFVAKMPREHSTALIRRAFRIPKS